MSNGLIKCVHFDVAITATAPAHSIISILNHIMSGDGEVGEAGEAWMEGEAEEAGVYREVFTWG